MGIAFIHGHIDANPEPVMENEMHLETLLELARTRKQNNTVIITFSDYRYKDVVTNWFTGLHRLNILNYLIISLDEQIHAFLDEQGIPNVLLKIDFNLDSLWLMRVKVFQFLCHNGIDFIHSDTDAVWLRNPIPEYFTATGCHIVASQGTTWPSDVLDAQRFVFCCGLFYVQSCRQTKAIFDEIATDILETGDDQISLNRILQKKDLRWDTSRAEHYHLHFKGRQFKCFNTPVTAYSPLSKLSIALLPQHLFQRLHMPGQQAYVKHLFAEKDSESKLDMFSRTGSLFIEPGPDRISQKTTGPGHPPPGRLVDIKPGRKKRLLVYGMQSSGASLFSYFLAQKAESLGIIDLNNHRLAPALPYEFDIVLKTVVTTRWSLEDHIENFQPDKTILFIRNPCSNYYSLTNKVYANKSGTAEEKFALLDSYFEAREQFDLTIFYEDFITDFSGTITKLKEIGWESSQEHYTFPRTPQEISEFNIRHSKWCRENPAAEGPSGGWGMGNIHSSSINLSLSTKPVTPDIIDKVKKLCPVLQAYYEAHSHLPPTTSPAHDIALTQQA